MIRIQRNFRKIIGNFKRKLSRLRTRFEGNFDKI